MLPDIIDIPCNWLQVDEYPSEPYHAVYLHSRAIGVQFNESPSWKAKRVIEWDWMPDEIGIFFIDTRRWNEFIRVRIAELFQPGFARPSDFNQEASNESVFAQAC